MKKEMISVIIPIYNRDYCLSRCLESVLQQTFTDWECILIDDGSTDRTLSVCRTYVDKDSRFQVYSQPNGGVSAARNLALEHAGGEYIAFIDSDDWVEPNYLQVLYESTGKSVMPLCGMDVQPINGHKYNCSVQNILYLTDSNIVDLMDKKAFELFAGPICKLYDRSIIETNGIRFPVGISWGEDLIFNCTYYRYVDCLKGIPLHLYHVLKQENSLTEEARGHFFLTDIMQILWENVSSFFKSRNIDSPILDNYYILLFFRQITHVRFVRDQISLIKRYRRMDYLIRSADRSVLKKYRFKNIRFLLVYYRLSTLFFICYEVFYFLMEHLEKMHSKRQSGQKINLL